ncbi:MAG: 50S ribosomal protein L18 [Chloroflexi bacterium]|nr:50S ribosomal protein L18 [Chloroflexota bacterium]
MGRQRTRKNLRLMRHARVRRRVRGTEERPRLSVFRALNHVYAQIIDDDQGKTLVAASSLDRQVSEQRDGKPKTEISKLVGKVLADRAKEKGVTTVVFDRGGFKYHGRVKALADALRKEGIVF